MKRILGLLSIVTSMLLSGGDWPEFRGPTAQGHVMNANLPLEFGPKKNLKWKVAVPGQGWSSPVIVGNRIYLTSAITKNGKLSLSALCLDTTEGRIIWQQPVFHVAGKAPRMHRKNSQASPTPIVSDKRVYIHFGHMGTACLDLTGKVIWKNESIKYPPVHGNGGSPALVNGKLIFSCDGSKDPFIIALNSQNGEQVWRTKRTANAKKKFSFCTPLVVDTADGKQVILPGSSMIGAYNPDTGAEIWKVTYGDGYSVVPRPVTAHGMVYFSSGFDKATALAVKLGGRGDVTESHLAWRIIKGAPHTPSMLAVGDELYMVSDGGIGSCVDARTGKVHWQERLGGSYSSSPIVSKGRIYYTNETGVVKVVKATKKFELLVTNELGERTLASPAVADNALFYRTEKHLWRF
ncbi:MAG: PQQ-binding-like beta-propeller repeat protein, partial [Verrucomicrobiota bacterium]|nr:PQQ-binding-like beta-propeller repeat protein [Verrucomicrobiota bacterium]